MGNTEKSMLTVVFNEPHGSRSRDANCRGGWRRRSQEEAYGKLLNPTSGAVDADIPNDIKLSHVFMHKQIPVPRPRDYSDDSLLKIEKDLLKKFMKM